MKEKINYSNCMKRKCEMCKYYDECFKYRGDKNDGRYSNINRRTGTKNNG